MSECLVEKMEAAWRGEQEYMASRCLELRTALQDILSRFQSAVGAGGKIPGDAEAIKRAERALRMD